DVTTALIWEREEEDKIVACGYHSRKVRVWEATTEHTPFTQEYHQGNITTLALSPSGLYTVSGSADTTVRICRDDQELYTYPGHRSALNVVAWSPKGDLIASSAADGSIHIWFALDPEKTAFVYTGHKLGKTKQGVSALAWSQDGKHIA